MHCCGKDSKNDYPMGKIPKSCCDKDVTPCNISNAYNIGCEPQIEIFFDNYQNKIMFASFGFAVFEVNIYNMFQKYRHILRWFFFSSLD